MEEKYRRPNKTQKPAHSLQPSRIVQLTLRRWREDAHSSFRYVSEPGNVQHGGVPVAPVACDPPVAPDGGMHTVTTVTCQSLLHKLTIRRVGYVFRPVECTQHGRTCQSPPMHIEECTV